MSKSKDKRIQLQLLAKNPDITDLEFPNSVKKSKRLSFLNRIFNNENSKVEQQVTITLKRFIGAVKKNNESYVAKVITYLDFNDWAEMHGYDVIRSFRIYGSINSDKEKTELAKC